MKFAALVLKSAVRNKRRTLLTVLSLGASLFLLVTHDAHAARYARSVRHLDEGVLVEEG